MSYNKKKLEEVFNNPHFQELIENKDWETLIEEGYFNNLRNKNNLASFIIQELNYPLFEQLDEIPVCCFLYDENTQCDFVIPGNIKTINTGAFFACSNLKSITIQDGITRIEDSAFSECTSLKRVTIPYSVKSIEADSFYLCKNLKDVYYEGTREQFKKIVNPIGNDYLFGANFHQI